ARDGRTRARRGEADRHVRGASGRVAAVWGAAPVLDITRTEGHRTEVDRTEADMDTTQTESTTQVPDSRPAPGTLPTAPLAAGQQAPDFALRTTPDQRVSLSAFAGRPIVLVFYPADWSPVCGDQLALYNELHDQWQKHHAQLLAISVDN